MRDIRRYNNAHSFASLGLDNPIVQNPDKNAFMPVYKIHGKIYHQLSALEPNPDARPAFAQAFFFDLENEIENRMRAHEQSNTFLLKHGVKAYKDNLFSDQTINYMQMR